MLSRVNLCHPKYPGRHPSPRTHRHPSDSCLRAPENQQRHSSAATGPSKYYLGAIYKILKIFWQTTISGKLIYITKLLSRLAKSPWSHLFNLINRLCLLQSGFLIWMNSVCKTWYWTQAQRTSLDLCLGWCCQRCTKQRKKKSCKFLPYGLVVVGGAGGHQLLGHRSKASVYCHLCQCCSPDFK